MNEIVWYNLCNKNNIKGEISKEEISKNEEPESAYKIYDKNYYIPK